ncbi:MAG: ankyrin repeat domain-containing protein [Alphaproteobacteria bacterium]|nr:ankyrin repeat domain-containing protein [Alphaproteobacteria bacterium]
MRRFLFLIILACLGRPAFAENLNIASSWFMPVLTEDNDPACKNLLKDAREKFFSDSSFNEAYGVRGFGFSETGTILDWEVVGGVGQGEIKAFGNTYYLDYVNHPGCGGACETNQPLISKEPFPKPRDYAYLQSLAEQAPPVVGYNYTIARASEDSVYLFSVSHASAFENQILVYRLALEGRWAMACRISTAPLKMPEREPFNNSQLLDSLAQLRQSVGGLMRGSGYSCGTMRTHSRWIDRVDDAFQTVLYRPWTLRERYPGVDEDGSYQNDMKYLKQWSLLGISEYRALQRFRTQFMATTNQLAAYFLKANGWPTDTAMEMASEALKGAVSGGIRFYMYDPHFAKGEEELRQAILEKQDISVIRTIPFDIENIDYKENPWSVAPELSESILSVAIEHPEALRLLLHSGLNPNHSNGFGKTPLMYAAQYNQIESASLLIEHGADVNAETTQPADSCYYTLRTFKMTPLHYAIRYASPTFIRLLLDKGARPTAKAQNHNSYPMAEETPLDWLRRFTGADSKERNPNISDDLAARIEKWLIPPYLSFP